MAILGIDLGTTNSLCAVWQNGESVLVPNALGEYLTPSAVSLMEDGTFLVGRAAKDRLVSHPESSAAVFKQFMGTEKEYILGARTLGAEELSGLVLRSLKESAEKFMGEAVTEAIISVPAYFNDSQRSATKIAGQLAGLRVDRILNEPSAAALCYRQLGELADGLAMVVDFGGGTLDISILECFDNIVDILAVAGDNHLGGHDIDAAIAAAFLAENPGLAQSITDAGRASLLQLAEQCKQSLTGQKRAFMVYRAGETEYHMALDNEKLMHICAPLLGRIKECVLRALRNAQTPILTIDSIILVGGSCRMPLVQQYIQHLCGKSPLASVDPDRTVALGVGVAAGIKQRSEDIRDMILTDICPFSLGVGTNKKEKQEEVFSPIIPRGSALPVSKQNRYFTRHDYQAQIRFTIYQGEAYEAKNNLPLAEVIIPVPKLPKGEASAMVRFTYDINGILDIEVTCEQTGETRHELVVSNKNLTQEEIAKRLEELQGLKIGPSDEDTLLLAQAHRLYEEFFGVTRERISQLTSHFEAALASGANPAQVARQRAGLQRYFNRLEAYNSELLLLGYAQEEPEWEDEEEYDE